MKYLVGLVIGAVSLTACDSTQLSFYDGKSASTELRYLPSGQVILREPDGTPFRAGKQVRLTFEINRFSMSELQLENEAGRIAKFKLPKKVLDGATQTFSLSAAQSGQPVDLIIRESIEVRDPKVVYDDVSEALIVPFPIGDGEDLNFVPFYLGENHTYKREQLAKVKRSFTIEIYAKGAQAQGFPAYLKQAEGVVLMSDVAESLQSDEISRPEYLYNR